MTQEIVAKSEASVALIEGALGSGSGFVVAPGLVATNAHVIDDEPIRRITVHFPSAPMPDRGPITARLRYKDARRDLALLEVETPLKPLELCRSHVFQRGEEITIIGSPGLRGQTVLKNAVNRGIVSTDVELDGHRFLQLGAAVNPGNSGGPAFNVQGEVIGVVTASAAQREAIGFCIPVSDLTAALGRSAALSRGQIAIAEKMHNVESIARRLLTARSIIDAATSQYLASMREALQVQGESLRRAILETKRQIGPQLAQTNERVTGSIRSEINELLADPDLPFQVRRDLESLWDAFVELRNFAEGPPEDVRLFMAALDKTRERFDEQIDRMKQTLGTGLDD